MNTEEAAHLDMQQKCMIQELFSQGVKHKMRMNFVRQMSKTSGENNTYFDVPVTPSILEKNRSFLKPHKESVQDYVNEYNKDVKEDMLDVKSIPSQRQFLTFSIRTPS